MIPIIMPRQGQSVESCIITKWHKKVGDVVSKGELLFSYETDKAAFDEETKEEGVVLSILSDEGDDVPCLQIVCYIGEAEENVAEEHAAGLGAEKLPPTATMSALELQSPIEGAVVSKKEAALSAALDNAHAAEAYNADTEASNAQETPHHVNLHTGEAQTLVARQHNPANTFLSPRARTLAEKSGADISRAVASGPNGRIIARDVQALIDQGKLITRAAQGILPQSVHGIVPAGVQGTGLGGRVTLHDIRLAEQDTSVTESIAIDSVPPYALQENSVPLGKEQHPTHDGPHHHAVDNKEKTAVMPPLAFQEIAQHPAYRDEPLSNIRKRIAKTMQQSIATMAQLTHTVTYDATNVLLLRKQYKEQGKHFGMEGVTLGDLIVFATVRTLTQADHAHLNAHYLGDTLRYFTDVHLGIAVDTARGLMVPTIRHANQKSLLEISNEIKALAAACQSGAVDPDLLVGASFTVSNLGAFEIEHFTPIINPPQTGVLGVNTLQQRVRDKDGQMEVYPAMSLSLTYDHRALDGAPASRFLRDLKRNLENIQLLMGGGVYHV